MAYESVAEMICSMNTKRNIKSKKKRIRKKTDYIMFWQRKRRQEAKAKEANGE